jgi:hypothetical protein
LEPDGSEIPDPVSDQSARMNFLKLIFCRLYTCRALAEYLTRNKMTILGTIKQNRRGIPAEYKDARGRKAGDYLCCWDVDSNMSLHSFIDKKKKGKALFTNIGS